MKLVVGNQKSYLDKNKIDEFVVNIRNVKSNNVIVCPSSIYFNDFKESSILLGSQNVSNYGLGATTGELSCEQLKSVGINISIVGHSERRAMLGESISDTNIKVKRLLENEMIPILCVGETLEERNQNKTEEVVFNEIKGAFESIDKSLIGKIIIAYEPIWAIGTGVVPTNKEIENTIKNIKRFLSDNYNCSNLVLYGGSVSGKNIDELNKVSSIDGYLIGGASTKIDEFLEIIEKCK